jgi:hypothetical protein
MTTTSSPSRSLPSIASSFGREASLPEHFVDEQVRLGRPGLQEVVDLVVGVLVTGVR